MYFFSCQENDVPAPPNRSPAVQQGQHPQRGDSSIHLLLLGKSKIKLYKSKIKNKIKIQLLEPFLIHLQVILQMQNHTMVRQCLCSENWISCICAKNGNNPNICFKYFSQPSRALHSRQCRQKTEKTKT